VNQKPKIVDLRQGLALLGCSTDRATAYCSPMEQIHGHEVIQMMLDSGKAYTRASLLTDIVAKFDPSSWFFTCSAENLTPEGMIDFLEAKGKFVRGEEGFQTSADLMCKH
jgi:probable metal-binding protein